MEIVVLLGALLAPAAVAVWLRPQRGVLLLLALLPFDGLLLLAPSAGPLTAWKELLLGGTLLAAVAARRRTRDMPPVPVWVWPLVALSAVAMVTVFWTPPLQALVGLKIAFFGMLAAAAVWCCPLSDRERDAAVTILAVTGAVVALAGLGQQVVGHARLHELGYEYNSVIRFTGGFMRSWSTFNQPFPFAFFLMVVTLVTTSVALSDVTRTRNQLLLAAVPLLLAGMAVAVVRASWFGLFAGLAYLAITRHRVLLAGVPLLVGAVLVVLVAGYGAVSTPASVEARFSRWQQLPAIVSQAPFGQGIGAAGAAAAKTDLLAGRESTFDPDRVDGGRVVFQPDNNYLKVLFELGVIGATLFVLALAAAFAATRHAEGDAAAGAFASGVSALVVAAAVASLASSFFEIFPLDYVFWLLVAVATTSTGRPDQLPRSRPLQLAAARSAS